MICAIPNQQNFSYLLHRLSPRHHRIANMPFLATRDRIMMNLLSAR